MSIADALAEALAAATPPPPNESATCLWIITPLIGKLGYAVREIEPHAIDTAGQFPDYTILPGTPNAWYLEAKAWTVKLEDRHAHQSLNYANQNGKRWVVLSNARRWRLYDNDVRGTASDKFVVEVELADLERMQRFLEAISKESMVENGLLRYATECRLEKVLASELADEQSELTRVLCNGLRRRTGLDRVSPAEVARYFRALVTGRGRPSPPITEAGPAPPVAEAPLEPANGSEAIGLDVASARARQYATNRQPIAVRLPDEQEVPVKTWVGVATAMVRWFGEQKLLPALPFTGSREGSRYFLNSTPEHPGRAMTRSSRLLIDGADVYIDVNRSGADFLQRLRALCEAAGVSPAQVSLRISLTPRWPGLGLRD